MTRRRVSAAAQGVSRILRRGFIAVLLAVASLLLVSAPVAGADSPPGSKERKPPTTWHATGYVRGSMGIRVIDYWSKGASMRARTMIGGHPILTLVDGDRYIAVDQLTAKGVSIRRPARAIAQDAKRLRPFAFELDEVIRDGGEKIEDMKIGPMEAEIWQVRDERGRRKVWVSAAEPRVPLRIETFSRAAGETHQLDYSNWIFDMDLPAEFFRAPLGMQLETLEYEAYEVRAAAGTVTPVPILYPDLLHGLLPN